jgi:hypothetical protein
MSHHVLAALPLLSGRSEDALSVAAVPGNVAFKVRSAVLGSALGGLVRFQAQICMLATPILSGSTAGYVGSYPSHVSSEQSSLASCSSHVRLQLLVKRRFRCR